MLNKIIVAFTLATSSAAVAQPIPYSGDRYDDRYDDGRRYESRSRQRFLRRAVPLAENVVLRNRDHRPTFLAVEAGYTFRRLRFDLVQGQTFIEGLHVQFADGHRETIPVRQFLSPRQPYFFVDLPHGGITGLFIDTAPTRAARGWGWDARRSNVAIVNIIAMRR